MLFWNFMKFWPWFLIILIHPGTSLEIHPRDFKIHPWDWVKKWNLLIYWSNLSQKQPKWPWNMHFVKFTLEDPSRIPNIKKPGSDFIWLKWIIEPSIEPWFCIEPCINKPCFLRLIDHRAFLNICILNKTSPYKLKQAKNLENTVKYILHWVLF